MALVVETGSGLRRADAYVPVDFVTTYLSERGRQTENSWNTLSGSAREAAVRAATSYIDDRWGSRFKGTRRTRFDGSSAQAIVTLTGIPIVDETVTLGSQVYVWKAALTPLANNEVIIGADATECTTNLLNSINMNGDALGVTNSRDMTINDAASAALEDGSTTALRLTARLQGASGNDIPLSETSANLTITAAFTNGLDDAPQQRAFPRGHMFDRDGLQVTGIPLKLKEATAEYAVRAATAQLFIDPVVDDTGRVIAEKFEKVGPIEERTRYEEGSDITNLLRPYPAADRMLAEYLQSGGGSFR